MPTADTSVRLAWPDDAEALARVQARAWRAAYATLLPADLLEAMDTNELTEAWQQAITRPQDARQRVLVALERTTVRGFVLCAPATDPDADPVRDGEMNELTVDPDHPREGHGSRLMQACVDTLRADRFGRALTWVGSTDDRTRAFLADAGWEPDGAHRTLDLRGDGSVTVKQVRLHAAL